MRAAPRVCRGRHTPPLYRMESSAGSLHEAGKGGRKVGQCEPPHPAYDTRRLPGDYDSARRMRLLRRLGGLRAKTPAKERPLRLTPDGSASTMTGNSLHGRTPGRTDGTEGPARGRGWWDALLGFRQSPSNGLTKPRTSGRAPSSGSVAFVKRLTKLTKPRTSGARYAIALPATANLPPPLKGGYLDQTIRYQHPRPR